MKVFKLAFLEGLYSQPAELSDLYERHLWMFWWVLWWAFSLLSSKDASRFGGVDRSPVNHVTLRMGNIISVTNSFP